MTDTIDCHTNGIFMAKAVALMSPMKRNRTGCVITDKRNNVISSGFNIMKTHPVQLQYAERANLKEKVYLHAEIHALIRLKNTSAKPHNIYVARLLANNSLAIAKPCPICMGGITSIKIPNIIYSFNDIKNILMFYHNRISYNNNMS